MTDRHTHDGPSCTTILVVRDFVSQGLSPSYMTVMMVRDPSHKGPHIFFHVSSDKHLRRTVVPMTVRPAHTFILVRDPPSGLSIYTLSKEDTTDPMIVRHSHDEPSPIP